MTREEFENKLEERGVNVRMQCISNEEYALIEKVYQFHPSISETEGKNEIADLFCKFGIGIIRDMAPRAEAMMKLESDWKKAQGEADRLKELMQEIREGGEI